MGHACTSYSSFWLKSQSNNEERQVKTRQTSGKLNYNWYVHDCTSNSSFWMSWERGLEKLITRFDRFVYHNKNTSPGQARPWNGGKNDRQDSPWRSASHMDFSSNFRKQVDTLFPDDEFNLRGSACSSLSNLQAFISHRALFIRTNFQTWFGQDVFKSPRF